MTAQPIAWSGDWSGEVHPLAAVWPLLAEDELQELAASIAENGQQVPIVCDAHGRLVDGRNRLAAVNLLDGVRPWFEVDPDLDTEPAIAAFIRAANADRRHLTAGQQAMGRALMLQAQGHRKNGRWERGSVVNGQSPITATDQDYVRDPGAVFIALLERDGSICYLCGQPANVEDPLEIEHVKPRSAGGSDDLSNLRLAHRSCNRRKGTWAVAL